MPEWEGILGNAASGAKQYKHFQNPCQEVRKSKTTAEVSHITQFFYCLYFIGYLKLYEELQFKSSTKCCIFNGYFLSKRRVSYIYSCSYMYSVGKGKKFFP